MKAKNIFRVFLTAVFVLGAMAMNAQTKVYVYKNDGTTDEYNIADVDSISFTPFDITPPTPTGENLLVNPGFEDPDPTDRTHADDLPAPWLPVDQTWFNDYYSGSTLGTSWAANDYNSGNRASADSNNGATGFFTGNAAPIADILDGKYCGRLALSNLAGMYQVVNNVTPGDYNISVKVAYATTNNNGVIQSNTIKILDDNNPLTLIGEVAIPTNNQTPRSQCTNPNGCGTASGVYIAPMTVTGTVTIPAGISTVRFQLDQRDWPNPPASGRAPLMLFDDCVFSKVEN